MKIVILGAGHMGAWIAKELSKEHQTYIYDKNCDRLAQTKNSEILKSLEEIKEINPELLVNAVSLPKTKEVFNAVIPFLSKDCMLCDLASVKGDLGAYYKETGFSFVSIHPMFGPTFANVENLADENIIIIEESCEKGKKFFNDFSNKLGLKIFRYTFPQHDEEVAYSLGVPFSASLVFASCISNIDAPGTTHRKHMQTARGVLSEDDFLLSEILFNPKVIPQIENITSKLSYLSHIIKSKNTQIMKEFLDELRKNIGL